jgi:hypothetical protein
MGDSSNDNGNARNDESSMWSWGGITEGLSTISGTTTSDERTDIGASKAEIQEMESAIAAAETAVSSAIFSTFSAVSRSFTSHNDKGRKSSTHDERNEKASTENDSDLDALTGADSEKDDPSSPNTEFSTSAAVGASKVPTETTESSTASSIWSTLAAVSESLDPTELIASATAAATSPETPGANMNSSNSENEKRGHDERPSSLWSTFNAVSDHILTAPSATKSSGTPAASSLFTLYSTKVNQAAEWIEELEHAHEESDPYQHLKHHLDTYLKENPRGVYEEWIKLWIQEQGWGAEEQTSSDSGTIDSSYYKEESIHRDQWNERNYQDGIGIDDEAPKRKYILTAKASLRDAGDAKDDSIKGEEDPTETSKDAITAFL